MSIVTFIVDYKGEIYLNRRLHTPVPITGLSCVWCIQARVENHLMIVHIVEGKRQWD